MHGQYITSYTDKSQFKIFDCPEVALVGKSNCGKSTLLNKLFNHKNLARTSKTPGRTQMINLFILDGKLIVADLPGHGYYQRAKSTIKISRKWGKLMDDYFQTSNLLLIIWLVDCRRSFSKDEIDYMFYLTQQLEKKLIIVLTKIDKLKKNQIVQTINKFKQLFAQKKLSQLDIIAVSSLKNINIIQLRQMIASSVLKLN